MKKSIINYFECIPDFVEPALGFSEVRNALGGHEPSYFVQARHTIESVQRNHAPGNYHSHRRARTCPVRIHLLLLRLVIFVCFRHFIF